LEERLSTIGKFLISVVAEGAMVMVEAEERCIVVSVGFVDE